MGNKVTSLRACGKGKIIGGNWKKKPIEPGGIDLTAIWDQDGGEGSEKEKLRTKDRNQGANLEGGSSLDKKREFRARY